MNSRVRVPMTLLAGLAISLGLAAIPAAGPPPASPTARSGAARSATAGSAARAGRASGTPHGARAVTAPAGRIAPAVLIGPPAPVELTGRAASGARAPSAAPTVRTEAWQSTNPSAQVATQDVGGSEMARPGVVVRYPATGAVTLPQVPCSAFVIADAGTGQVLAAQDAHGLFAPASTLKVLTAITLIPRLNPNATVVATQQEADTEPNDIGLVPGQRYKVSDLFNALLLISANDAAVALTTATGSLAGGMALINAEAHNLQAYDVVAKQPNGLPAAGQVVSAYDEALIARQALATPAFMKYDSTVAARFPLKSGASVPLLNQNTLLTQYPGGIGGKIGWTEAAQATYIGLARRHGETLIVTELHCTSLQEITSGEKLLDWGFAMDGKVRPAGHLVRPLHAMTTSTPGPASQPGTAGQAGGPNQAGGSGRAGTARQGNTSGQAGRSGQPGAGRPGMRNAASVARVHNSSPLPLIVGGLAALAAVLTASWVARRRRRPAPPA
jgi:D-alanyl-D-alanine carboxypeptidase (penicillin-binding protein 5/6)